MKKFRITVLILFAIGIVFMIMGLIVSNSNLKHDARSNTECRTDQRVFDYADKLTGNEEQSLEKKIAKWEDKTGMDIVVMTIDNAQAQSMFGTYMDDTYYEEFEAIKTVAKSFSEQERFGWENWEYNPQSNRSMHKSDTMQEKLSLVNRFGVTINYSKPSQKEYFQIVVGLAEKNGIHMTEEELCAEANKWELSHGGISGRTAQQFINYLAGKQE